MKSVQIDKRYTLLRYFEVQGARYFRRNASKVDSVPKDDIRRTEARNAILRELEDVALMAMLDSEASERHAEAVTKAGEKRQQDAEKAAQTVYKKASAGKPAGLQAFLSDANLGALVTVGESGGRSSNDPVSVLELIHGGARAGFAPGGNTIAVCVKCDAADAFEKLYQIPATLSYEAEGFRVWIMGAGLYSHGGHLPVGFKGERLLVAGPVIRGQEVLAPIADAAWIVPPSKVKLEGGKLPACPESLATALVAACNCTVPRAIDKLIL